MSNSGRGIQVQEAPIQICNYIWGIFPMLDGLLFQNAVSTGDHIAGKYGNEQSSDNNKFIRSDLHLRVLALLLKTSIAVADSPSLHLLYSEDLATPTESRPHLAYLLRKRVLSLSDIVHISNERVLTTVQKLLAYKEWTAINICSLYAWCYMGQWSQCAGHMTHLNDNEYGYTIA